MTNIFNKSISFYVVNIYGVLPSKKLSFNFNKSKNIKRVHEPTFINI
jgi:hypothetical protein